MLPYPIGLSFTIQLTELSPFSTTHDGRPGPPTNRHRYDVFSRSDSFREHIHPHRAGHNDHEESHPSLTAAPRAQSRTPTQRKLLVSEFFVPEPQSIDLLLNLLQLLEASTATIDTSTAR